ncbi:MAG: NUDIX domain-containing protein [Minisyncoccia bacterium]
MKKFYSVIVNGVIVNNEGKVLIAQRSPEEGHEGGKWSISGGKIESTGEEHGILLKNIKKEILEEVGVEIFDDVVMVHNNTFTRSNGDDVLALVFLCKYKSGEARPLEDTVDVRWIGKNEIDNFQFPPNVKEYVLEGFS